ncbi:MAG: YceD family protein [Anaeroplasmataceae bacterium]
MKFSFAQLRKLKMPHLFEEKLDLSNELNDFEDIKKINNVNVKYELNELTIGKYLLKMNIKCNLILECSISLDEISYDVDVDVVEQYSSDDKDTDCFKIEGQTLDTLDAVITNIIIAKPMKVTREGVVYNSPIEDFVEEEKKVNPAFKDLKDFLKIK